MSGEVIRVHVRGPGVRSFEQAVQQAVGRGSHTMEYLGHTFWVGYTDPRVVRDVVLVLNGIRTPLPEAIEERLAIDLVVVRAPMTSAVKAKPGLYAGWKFGFNRRPLCFVDPDGTHNDSGYKGVECRSNHFSSTVHFYKNVVDGAFQPGNRTSPWSEEL
jgi:hypothetical protein